MEVASRDDVGMAAHSAMGVPPPDGMEDPDLLLLLLPLVILICAIVLVAITPCVFYVVLRLRGRIALGDHEGPVNIAFEEQMESRGSSLQAQQRWAEQADVGERQGHERAVQWCTQHPPASPRDTDITMPQFLGIQEKGVSAWNFDTDYEANPGVMVSARTELQFFADSAGMAPSEGGACAMQTNLPLPKINEVYYWEAKIFSKPASTSIAVGLATKPYPPFRFPGLCRHSVGYFSEDGFKCYNHPLHAQSYGPAFMQGDVVGVGYRPRSGAVFFTRNGRRMEEAYVGLHGCNLFPTIAADGAAEVHVNLGQAGFVLIEGNVKKWGLAPMVGTLAPPPAYGHDKGSILIQAGYEPRQDTHPTGSSSRDPTLTTDRATGELVRVPSYSDVAPPGPSPSRTSSSSAHTGIHMDTLTAPRRPQESPPPYEPQSAALGPARHQHPTPHAPSFFTTIRGWLAHWNAHRSAPADPTNPTELVGVVVE